MSSKLTLVAYQNSIIPVIGRFYDMYVVGKCSVRLLTSEGLYEIEVVDKFYTDGVSGNFLTHKVLPAWKTNDDRYNVCGLVHDILYEYKGFGIFSRDDCDAIFRGMLREYGYGRAVASTADFVLGLCAKRHWGPDGTNTNRNSVRIRRLRD